MSKGSTTLLNWAPVLLGELGQTHCGQSPSAADVNSDREGTVYISGPEHWDGHAVGVDKWTTNPKRIVPDGCLFITVKGAGVGTIFPGIAAAIGRDVYAFQPHHTLDVQFVRWALVHTVEELKRNAVGDIPGLSKSHISDHRIDLPPLPEQHRIVKALDSYFTRLDDAVATLERVQRNLERYRASVLKAAVEGRLVPTEAELARAEGRDYEPAVEAIHRTAPLRRPNRWAARSKSVMIGHAALAVGNPASKLPAGWEWTQLADIARMESGHTPSRQHPEWWGGNIPWIGIKDARKHHGRVIHETAQHTNEEGLANSA